MPNAVDSGNPVKQIPTKERILDVAEHHFANKGFDATSVVEIAADVGIRGPAVYKHFDNKLALYDAVLTRLFEPFKTMAMHTDTDDVAVDEKTGNYYAMETLIDHHIQHPNISKIIQQATLAGGEQLEQLAQNWYIPFFREVKNSSHGGYATVMAFHSMLLGYITLAPLHEKIFAMDPLDENILSDQLRLQKQLSSLLAQKNWQW